MTCPCSGLPMIPVECARCLNSALEQIFGMADKFEARTTSLGVEVVKRCR